VSDLMTAYLLWAREYGEKFALARRAFNEALISKGIKQGRDSNSRFWSGIELKIEAVKKLRASTGEQGYL
jgi:phage/plasmid-associated DNA primase